MMPQILLKGFLTLVRRPGVILGALAVAGAVAGALYVQNLRANLHEEVARAKALEARVEELEDEQARLKAKHAKTLQSLEERSNVLKKQAEEQSKTRRMLKNARKNNEEKPLDDVTLHYLDSLRNR